MGAEKHTICAVLVIYLLGVLAVVAIGDGVCPLAGVVLAVFGVDSPTPNDDVAMLLGAAHHAAVARVVGDDFGVVRGGRVPVVGLGPRHLVGWTVDAVGCLAGLALSRGFWTKLRAGADDLISGECLVDFVVLG